MEGLWVEIMRRCLQRAEKLLDRETAPTAETVEAVKGLVETAISINSNSYGSPIGPSTTNHLKET